MMIDYPPERLDNRVPAYVAGKMYTRSSSTIFDAPNVPPRKDFSYAQKNLPVYGSEDEILSAIAKNQVLLIFGEPRRLATIEVAKHIAHEQSVGNTVGYQVRFDKFWPTSRELNCHMILLLHTVYYEI